MKAHQEKPLRILVVDDDVDLLMLLERIFTKAGYLVESAASLPEAEYVQSLFHPELIFMDINVGGSDGRQLCWKIKNTGDHRDTKVILMSGTNCPTNRTLLFGADDFLAKPFNAELILHKTQAALDLVAPLQLVPLKQAI